MNKIPVFGAVIGIVVLALTLGLAFAGYIPVLSPLIRGENSAPALSPVSSPTPSSNLRTFTVVSSSMEPTIMPGGKIVCEEVPFDSLKISDIIVYRSPMEDGSAIAARIVSINSDNAITKGDNNPSNFPWNVNASLLIGKVVQINNP